ncbi:MAG: response regulator [Nitrospira sp.]|nr:response regulator [Nitrospira sp.]
MVVICPKCKTKLKVDDGKLTEAGSRFKCPKCSTVLLVKKPPPAQEKPMDNIKILVAHSNPAIINEIIPLLNQNGFETITASDGIEAMVKAIKELPFLTVIEVSLPKIYGFEVCKRLKARPETKGMKFILISSPYDKNRYRREPESFYDADDYIEEHRITGFLMDSINAFRSKKPDEKKEERVEKPAEAPIQKKTEQKTEPEIKPAEKISAPYSDDKIERARRLARTIISDIYLYNTAKADESIRKNTFSSVFSPEIKEGLKLYENRIAQEVRDKGDFFKEVLSNFLENKKKSL